MAERDGDPFRDVGLAPVGGAELHRRRGVEHEPADEHTLGEVLAYVRLAGPGRDVPVDSPHVVAGDVRSDLGQLGPVTVDERAVVAGEQALDPASDADVERAKQALGQRPGTWPVGRALRAENAHAALAAWRVVRSICGTGTAAITWSRIVSGLTSSARAW
jgi:hypothetical protein